MWFRAKQEVGRQGTCLSCKQNPASGNRQGLLAYISNCILFWTGAAKPCYLQSSVLLPHVADAHNFCWPQNSAGAEMKQLQPFAAMRCHQAADLTDARDCRWARVCLEDHHRNIGKEEEVAELTSVVRPCWGLSICLLPSLSKNRQMRKIQRRHRVNLSLPPAQFNVCREAQDWA